MAILFLIEKAFCLETFIPDAEAQEKADESDATEHTESQGFALGSDLHRGREEGAGEERSDCSTGCRQCLSEAVDSAKNGVIGCRIGDLSSISLPLVTVWTKRSVPVTKRWSNIPPLLLL